MPAVGSHRRHDTHDLLLPAVPPRPVNHVISLDRYYRSADLVLRQVGTHGCLPALPAPGVLYCAGCGLVLSLSLLFTGGRVQGRWERVPAVRHAYAFCWVRALPPAYLGSVFWWKSAGGR